MSREICKACWQVSAVGFKVPDAIWELAVPEPLREGVLCLACFARFADENFLLWDHDIAFSPVSLETCAHCVDLAEYRAAEAQSATLDMKYGTVDAPGPATTHGGE